MNPFTLVLHNHLPMVVNHGRWPHGSDWLSEAAFECYLPLLDTAHRLIADGISPKWTVNLSPILVEQLASPDFQKELAFYYEMVRRNCRGDACSTSSSRGSRRRSSSRDFWEDVVRADVGAAPPHRRRHSGDVRRAAARPPHRDHHLRGHPRLPAPALARRVHPPPAAHRRGDASPALRPGAARHLAARSAPTGRATSGRPPPGRTGAASGSCARASRRCWPSTGSSTSWSTPIWWRPAPPSSPTATTSRCPGNLERQLPPSRVRTDRRTTPIGSPRGAAPAPRWPSSAIPKRPFRCGAVITAIRASSPIWSFTRSTGRAGSSSGASPTPSAIWPPRSSTIPPTPLQKVRLHARHFAELVQDTLAQASGGRTGRWCARPTTPSCSATGGSKVPPGSSRWRVRCTGSASRA